MSYHGDTRKPRVGVLLVHGIGQQAPGAFLGEFRDGFGRLLGARTADIVRQDPAEPSRRIHAATIELDDRTLMLYEVHWANLITPEMARASFDPVQLFLLAWFPWFNKQLQLPGFDKYSQSEIKSWTYRLVPLTLLFFLGYIGLKGVPYHIMRAWDAVNVVSMTAAFRLGCEKRETWAGRSGTRRWMSSRNGMSAAACKTG